MSFDGAFVQALNRVFLSLNRFGEPMNPGGAGFTGIHSDPTGDLPGPETITQPGLQEGSEEVGGDEPGQDNPPGEDKALQRHQNAYMLVSGKERANGCQWGIPPPTVPMCARIS